MVVRAAASSVLLYLCRYLLQQGYAGGEQPDICILTPYVGQLMKLRTAIAEVSDLRFVISDRDAADLADVITDATTEQIQRGILTTLVLLKTNTAAQQVPATETGGVGGTAASERRQQE